MLTGKSKLGAFVANVGSKGFRQLSTLSVMIRRTLLLLAAVCAQGVVMRPAVGGARIAVGPPARSAGANMGLLETVNKFIFGQDELVKSRRAL